MDGHGQPACSPEKPAAAEQLLDRLEVSPAPGHGGGPQGRCSKLSGTQSLACKAPIRATDRAAQMSSPKDGGFSSLALCLLLLDQPMLGHQERLSLASQVTGTGA